MPQILHIPKMSKRNMKMMLNMDGTDMMFDLLCQYIMIRQDVLNDIIFSRAVMLVRHAEDDKKYLYDFLSIKKKRAARLSHKTVR